MDFVTAEVEACVFVRAHGVRLFFRLKPFIAERFFPSGVRGPVLSPPWNLQRALR